MTVRILIEETPLSLRVARVEGEVVTDLRYAFPTRGTPSLGELYRAKVTDVDKRLGAVFLDLGGASGFLRRSGPLPDVGRSLIVEVRREPIGGKGADVSDRPALRLPAATALLEAGELKPGPLGETDIHVPKVSADGSLGLLGDVPPAVRWLTLLARSDLEIVEVTRPETKAALSPFLPEDVPIEVISPTDAAALLDEAEEAGLARTHGLVGGGRLVIEETEALFAIDLDLGQQGGQSKKGAGQKLLGEALAKLGQLGPVLGLGGQLVIDIPRGAIAAPKIVRDQITRALKPLGRVSVPAVTPEGVCVVIAPRPRPSMLEVLTEPTNVYPRAGRQFRPDVIAAKAFRLAEKTLTQHRTAQVILFVTDRATPLLAPDSAALHNLTSRFGPRLTIEAMDPNDPRGEIHVEY